VPTGGGALAAMTIRTGKAPATEQAPAPEGGTLDAEPQFVTPCDRRSQAAQAITSRAMPLHLPQLIRRSDDRTSRAAA